MNFYLIKKKWSKMIWCVGKFFFHHLDGCTHFQLSPCMFGHTDYFVILLIEIFAPPGKLWRVMLKISFLKVSKMIGHVHPMLVLCIAFTVFFVLKLIFYSFTVEISLFAFCTESNLSMLAKEFILKFFKDANDNYTPFYRTNLLSTQ